jgi:hypothetical protein
VNRPAAAAVYHARNNHGFVHCHGRAKEGHPMDPRFVNLEDSNERAYWCKFFGVSLERLIEAVKAAGPSAQDVREFLRDVEEGRSSR